MNTTGNPLDMELMSVADGMKIHIEYNAARYSEKFIETFAACYENILHQLMTKTFVREVELLDDEQKKILDAFNATEVDYDKNQTVVSLFNTAAEKFFNNTAVIFEDKKFSYREVDAMSNDIAAYILSKKISGSVESFCRENKLMPAALCFAALSYVVARYSANRKVYLTTISSGRSNVKFFETFGMFVNTLPLAAELENIFVAEFLKKISKKFRNSRAWKVFLTPSQAKINPDKVALIVADCSLTYKELDEGAIKSPML